MLVCRYGYIDELVKVELAERKYAKAGAIYLENGKYPLNLRGSKSSTTTRDMTTCRYEEAAGAFILAKDMESAVACMLKQAKSLEIKQLVEAQARKLDPNAKEFVPQSKSNKKQANKNTNQGAVQPNVKPILNILHKAKTLLAEQGRTDFEVDILPILHYICSALFLLTHTESCSWQ